MNEDPKQLRERFEPKETKVLTADPQVVTARFSPCGKFLAAASFDARVRRWDAAGDDLPELAAIDGHGGWVTALAFAPQGEVLYSADSWGQIRATANTGETLAAKWAVKDAHDGWVRELAVSPDGSRLASCGMDKQVRLWSTADGGKQQEFATGPDPKIARINGDFDGDVSCIRFSPDGQSLLTADLKGVVKLWDLATGNVARAFNAESLFKLDRLQDCGGVHCLTLDREGKLLAVGGTQPKGGGTVTGIPTLLVFDFATGELKHTLTFGQPNDCFVSDAAFHSAGFVMVTTCGTPGSGQLLFQRLEDKEPFFVSKKMLNCQSLTAHPDGQRLAVVATNGGSNGNGRPVDKDGKYPGNQSPIYILRMPAPPS